MQCSSQSLIDRLYAAESVITLFAQLDVARFPWDERIAVGACQAKALEAWFEAYPGERPRLRSRRSHQAVLRAVAETRPLMIG